MGERVRDGGGLYQAGGEGEGWAWAVSMDRQGGKVRDAWGWAVRHYRPVAHCLHLQAEEVLLSVLSDSRQQRSASERWAAAQTLVSAGVVSASIVEELLSHLLNSYNPRHQAKAARLLAVQSSGTVSVCRV